MADFVLAGLLGPDGKIYVETEPVEIDPLSFGPKLKCAVAYGDFEAGFASANAFFHCPGNYILE